MIVKVVIVMNQTFIIVMELVNYDDKIVVVIVDSKVVYKVIIKQV